MVPYEAAFLLTERFTELLDANSAPCWPCVWLWTSHSISLSLISKMRVGNLATVSYNPKNNSSAVPCLQTCRRRFQGDLCNPCFQRRCLFFQVGKLSGVIHASHCGDLGVTLSLFWCCVCVIVFSLRTDTWPSPPHTLSIHTVTLHPLSKWETNIWGTIICGHLLLAAQ